LNNLSRDDARINRLSSFLYWEGNLEAAKIHPIKRNVYYIETVYGEKYVLKGHSNASNLKQQWEFFEKIRSREIIPFVRYPNGKREISTGTNYYWTISPYVSGRKLNYKSEIDRKKAVHTVKKFHQQASHVYINKMIKKQLFFKRWETRLNKFEETEQLFNTFSHNNLYEDIRRMMRKYTELVSNFNWNKDQLNAERNGIWVHGDVASHNFIQNEKTWLIDFDLLHCTSQLYDYIQLGQRFLPNINWDVETLLSYGMVDEEDLDRYLFSVFIPSDLLREWLHFLTRKRSQSVETYLLSMEEEWLKRKEFLRDSILLIK
jgi:hypothetical protein